MRWIVEEQHVVGLSFRDGHYVTNGRYEAPMLDEVFMDELQVWADDGGVR